MKPSDGGRLGVSERKREQIRSGPAPAAHIPTHREPAAPQALRNTLAQGIAPRNHDLRPRFELVVTLRAPTHILRWVTPAPGRADKRRMSPGRSASTTGGTSAPACA